MKRTKILVLAAAAQLVAWISIAGEPVPASFLRRTAGQVQAAGWTGGNRVDVPAAPRIDPKTTSAVSDESREPSNEDIIRLVDSAGKTATRSLYRDIVAMLRLSPLREQDVVQQVTNGSGNRMRTVFVRRRGEAVLEVILASGIREDGTLKVTYYVVSSQGRLQQAVYKENGHDPVDVPLRRASQSYPQEIRTLWQDYHRTLAGNK